MSLAYHAFTAIGAIPEAQEHMESMAFVGKEFDISAALGQEL